MRMKVVVDKYVPYIADVLGGYADVVSLEPEAISAAVVRDADALIVRTRTRCDAALLDGSSVQFIATATIGFDHIDTAYCEAHGIVWMACPGCNAQGVCDYVETAIACLLAATAVAPTIGVVGVGHIGSKVVAMAQRKGWRVLQSDPLREAMGEIDGVTLEQIAREADVITFHTPLTRSGGYPTYHLWDKRYMDMMKPQALLINAARGGVVKEEDLIAYLDTHRQVQVVIDCWEGEPLLNNRLLERANIATYHIAGYTLDGKYHASKMCLEGLIRYFGVGEEITQQLLSALAAQRIMPTQPQVGFNIQSVSTQLKKNPSKFDELRKSYSLR